MPYTTQEYGTNAPRTQQLNAFQQQKVVDNLKLVKWIVSRIAERLPRHIDSEDLMHSGIMGLIDAVQRFSWGRDREDEEFRAYAECRIRGQVMDELRHLDMLPRSARDKVNHFKREVDKLRKKFNREPSEHEICDEMKIDMETCHHLRAEANGGRQISLDTQQNSIDAMEGILKKTLNLINPHTPEGMLHVKEVRGILADEIDKLNQRERQVISMYYLEEMTLKEIGSVLSITESRVSQIHAQALNRLMLRIKSTFGLEGKDAEDL